MSNSSQKLKFGDIYIVRFHPSIGSELKRYRPAVIVSSKSIDSRFTTIVPITSNRKKYPHPYSLKVENEVLDKPSAILPWYLRTIDVVRLERKLGELEEKDKTELKLAFEKVLG